MAENERELSPAIKIGRETYHVNAKQAESTKGTLTIYENGPKISSDIIVKEEKSFNGHENLAIGFVPSKGGTFEGPVFKTPTAGNITNIDESEMLNKSEIGTLIAETTGAGWFTWNRSNQKLTPAAQDVNGNQHFGVVVGTEAALIAPDTDELNFMSYNNANRILPRFLYICGVSGDDSETGNLYYGELDETKPVRLAPSADEVEIAEIAKTLKNSTSFIVELGRITPYEFNGTPPSTAANAGIGVTGKLAIANGGTNAITEQDACDNLISEQNISPKTIRLSAGDNDRVHRKDSSSGTYNHFGIDLCYSDIVRLNALYFGTQANSAGEGLNFVHNTIDNKPVTWDRLYAKGGALYFDRGTGDGVNLVTSNNETGTRKTVFHSGCVIPPENGGTGKGNLADVIVGNANKIKTSTGTYAEIVVSKDKPSNSMAKGTIWVQLPG